jgi:Protein of unknown function (DUF2711)
MTNRVLPASDKFASCPYDGKVLSYYDGQFDSVYVLLNPFIRPLSLPMERFCPEKWPSKQELIDGAEPIPWDTVLKLTDLQTLDEIDIGLRTSIGGLNEKYADVKLAETLSQLTEKRGVVHPSEGDVSPFIENKLYESLQLLGHEWLWVGDEFCSERRLVWIDDLKKGDELPAHGCAFTPDKTILVTSHWDSHFSFLCSTESKIEQILKHENFEGFFCTPETEVYWSLAATND